MASRTPPAHDFSNPENNAPEVVERPSDLIPAPNQTQHEMQYPQVMQQYPETKSYPSHDDHDAPSHTLASSPNGNYCNQEKSKPLLGDAGLEVATKNNGQSGRRKRMIWIIAGVVLILLAIALAVGLGVGLSSSSKDNNNNSNDSQNATQPTTTATSSVNPSSTTTTSAPAGVTSGTTGIAAFSCGSQLPTDSTAGTTFTQECYTQYTTNRASYYHATDNVTTINLGGKYTTYNLTACLDECDAYNTAGGTPPCRAVTYYANLSAPIQAWGGNCFLKNDRGTDAHVDAVDWSHTMSAFMDCLNVTCSGSN